MTPTPHVYEVRPRKDHRGVDLISDVLNYAKLSLLYAPLMRLTQISACQTLSL